MLANAQYSTLACTKVTFVALLNRSPPVQSLYLVLIPLHSSSLQSRYSAKIVCNPTTGTNEGLHPA